MTVRRLAAVTLVVALALSVAIVAACRGKLAEVSSKWPRVQAERAASRPAASPRWPLTGASAPSAAAVARRVVSVKVENSPEARPQTGLQTADVVYEILTEGGISRFNAMYHSKTPEAITPVRSARMPDLRIVPQYHAIFAYAGSNNDVKRLIRSSGIDDMDFGTNPGAYWRGGPRRAPHDLFVDVAKLRREAVDKRRYPAKERVTGFAFSASVDTTAPATTIRVPFSPANRVEWTYDSSSRKYARENNGRVHTDAETGRQLTATNVVVMWAKTTRLRRRDVSGSPTYDVQVTGKNRATVFRDGVRIDGFWHADEDSPPVFRAKDGRLIKLRSGNTWLQVVPSAVNISFD